jgi:hypothetical protein
VQSRQIRTGIESANLVEVISGLNAGDQVIVGNLNSFQPGQTVEPRLSAVSAGQAVGGAQ